MTAEVEQILVELSLQQYRLDLLRAGFRDWESLSGITESDLAALNIRRGHRRKLQREIARRRRWPDLSPLPTVRELHRHIQFTRDETSIGNPSNPSEDSFYSLNNTSSRERSLSFNNMGASTLATENDTEIRAFDILKSRAPFLKFLRDFVGIGITKPVPFQAPEGFNKILHRMDIQQVDPPAAVGVRQAWLESPQALIAEVREAMLAYPQSAFSTGSRRPWSGIDETPPSFHPSALEPYLEAFFQKLNHFLYLFSEFDLRQSFENMFGFSGQSTNQSSAIEICLVLAIGAKSISFQAQKAYLEWYSQARSTLSRDEWGNNLWVMRTLALLCIYHIDENVDISCHFLDLALRVGKAIGLDVAGFPLEKIQEPERSHWLRVWESLRFLQTWFRLCSQFPLVPLSEYLIETENPPIMSDECYNSRLTQMGVLGISSFLSEVLKDSSATSKPSPDIYKAHLLSLDRWYAGLPPYLCLRPRGSKNSAAFYQGTNDRQKSSLLIIHSLYFGTICQLLQLAVIKRSQSASASEAVELHLYSSRCVESAASIIQLCKEITDSGYNLSGCWVPLHFLFNAALILVFDASRARPSPVSFSLMQERIYYIKLAKELLNCGADISASPQAIIVEQFCDSLGIIV